ncbi:MalY/PatB family protein [Butyricimonas sp. Marseille-P3923]|uniref:MalY/PatB family protein n=1 Tax=Butyricimonas sp. Marseille-P3923 TaxID=1987504 RepID=UPI000C075241|nr:PatB family C-S lyase [Butyricimonas sp. Marseille-P3923]
MYNFDQIIDRRNTACAKYDNLANVFGVTDILPMWVADMDFQVAPEILEAVRQCCEKGVFGYTFRTDEAKQAFIDWTARRHGWQVKQEWILSSPGIVTALSLAVRVYTGKGDKVLIFTPVYPPFHAVVKDNQRELVCSTLKVENGHYRIDWEDFERKLQEGVKLLIISNSHNPVGRVWTKDELTRMGNLCLQHGVTILSDEIHADLTLFGHKHTVMAALSPEIADITVTMMAPSKTFNIAGMMNSVIVISSPELRRRFEKEILCLHLDLGNIFGHITLEAAYKHGDAWLDKMLRYLEKNITYTDQFLQRELPRVKMIPPEGSFLLWLDFRDTGLTHEQVREKLLKEAKIGLNSGTDFGEEGRGFFRMNIGCPLATVKEGLERIKKTFIPLL